MKTRSETSIPRMVYVSNNCEIVANLYIAPSKNKDIFAFRNCAPFQKKKKNILSKNGKIFTYTHIFQGVTTRISTNVARSRFNSRD